MTGAAVETGTTLRLCETESCDTKLSRFNSRPICAACEARLEIGGAVIPLARQPRFASRPPAPERPTTEGGITLPGVVKGRERSYEEMIAKPAADTPAPLTCAECGGPLDAKAEGWLCGRCQGRAIAKRGIIAAAEHDKRTFSTRNPEPKPKGRGGRKPTFDHAEAARLFAETHNYSEVARRLGVANKTARSAVIREYARRGAPLPASTPGRPPRPEKRRFDYADAAKRYQEGASYDQLAKHYGVRKENARKAVWKVLGEDAARAIAATRRGRRPVAPVTPPGDPPPPPAARRVELARLAAELDDIHNQQTRPYARWRVTTERYAELLRDDA